MLDNFLFFLKRFIPRPLFDAISPIYHWLLAFWAAVLYGFPAYGGMKVVGVTGTSGKTTTVHFLHAIFEEAGFKTASISGLRFKILNKEEANLLKITMPGRGRLQKFLREAKNAGCEYVFLEVTSEGIKQSRHKFIKFYAALFTNLSKEHIEAHGSFENYRETKGELFKNIPLAILNGEDPNFEYFYKIAPKEKIVFVENDYPPELVLNFRGKFNRMNAVAALTFAKREGIDPEVSKNALRKIPGIPGRMEYIETKKDFKVLVDYAFIPDVLRKVYEEEKEESSGLVCVLGAAGGGRDRWKRPVLGDIAGEFCRKVFVTNEDPYDEDPMAIMNEVCGRHNFEKILDRREAIRRALRSAGPGETVVITGKGAEPWIMGPGGSRAPWDERKIVREELSKI